MLEPTRNRGFQHSFCSRLRGALRRLASVVDEGERRHHVYLPDGGIGWYEFYRPGEFIEPGRRVELDAPLDRLPVLVRAGGSTERVKSSPSCPTGSTVS
ncbi:hypothetical protein [uncultured Tessaracoccus sp.]|uniref:hypothetical protein n=1 Tax=uncultured Tessaracoccus sp. TaxID=905023 RepID=UPI002639A928|nr:hypothetical protein [uncultured Tessaracoccus sp.]